MFAIKFCTCDNRFVLIPVSPTFRSLLENIIISGTLVCSDQSIKLLWYHMQFCVFLVSEFSFPNWHNICNWTTHSTLVHNQNTMLCKWLWPAWPSFYVPVSSTIHLHHDGFLLSHAIIHYNLLYMCVDGNGSCIYSLVTLPDSKY